MTITPYKSIRVQSAPSTAPVTLEEAKMQCRVDSTIEDTYISGLIDAATLYVEDVLGTSIETTTWETTYDCFPAGAIYLPRAPMKPGTAVTIEYIDLSGNEVTLTKAGGDFSVDQYAIPPAVYPNYLQVWPPTRNVPNAVTVRWSAGQDDPPPTIKHAVLLLVAHWYENRQPVIAGQQPANVPATLDTLLSASRNGVY